MSRRVVITGLGIVASVGTGANAFWRGVTAGRPGLVAAPEALAERGARVVGAVSGFSGAQYLKNERHARVLNRSFELLVGATALAAGDAGLGAAPVAPARLSVVVGIGPVEQYTDDLVGAVQRAVTPAGVDVGRFAEEARALYPLRRLRLLPNVGPAVLSIEHQAMGPSLTIVSGDTSGLQATAEGLAMIREGRVDAVLCGGADSRLTPLGVTLFGRLSPLSASTDPRTACRPFDRDRDGVVAGEAAAIVLLEAEDSARARRADPYAELAECASSGAAEGGCAQSMRRAAAGRPDGMAEVVVAHGDGSVRGDRAEAAALDAFAPRCITSLQPAVGHTMSACGAVNLVAGCLILADDRVPPIRTLRSPEATLPFATHEVHARFSSVLVNALDPDGHAASALLVRR